MLFFHMTSLTPFFVGVDLNVQLIVVPTFFLLFLLSPCISFYSYAPPMQGVFHECALYFYCCIYLFSRSSNKLLPVILHSYPFSRVNLD